MFWPQIWGLCQSRGQRISNTVIGIAGGVLISVMSIVAIVMRYGTPDGSGWAWIDVVYALGYAKLVITVVKYMPQVWTNYQRQSTRGWSIGQILLDVTGGVLSIAQLVIDCSLQADWSGLVGNPVKFGLGNVSIIFDIIFMVQHYGLYRGRGGGKGNEGKGVSEDDGDDGDDEDEGSGQSEGERRGLLDRREDRGRRWVR